MVLADNLGGMRRAVIHLIEVHDLRQIAFIRGPAGQIESELRHQAYLKPWPPMASPGPDLVVQGDFSQEGGRAAMQQLLDRGMGLQAVVAANDHMAIGALELLRERGLRVPEDIAVVGFDDIGEGQYHGIPLTTVRQLFYTAGQQATRTLLRRIRGQEVPAQSLAPAELVVRRSCGCLPVAGWTASEGNRGGPTRGKCQRPGSPARPGHRHPDGGGWGSDGLGRRDGGPAGRGRRAPDAALGYLPDQRPLRPTQCLLGEPGQCAAPGSRDRGRLARLARGPGSAA